MRQGCLTSELRAAEYVAEEVVVVEAPHPVAPCRLKFVDVLQSPAEAQIPHEQMEHSLSLDFGLGLQESNERQT